MIPRIYRRYEALILGILSLVGICVIWQAAVDLGFIKAFFVSRPTDIWEDLLAQIASGALFIDIRESMKSFGIALCLATVVGIGLGILAGWFRDFEAALNPFIWFKYSAPTIAFYPIFVAFLGYGTPTIAAIAFLFALTPIYANTLSGIKNADPDLVRAARAFGARPMDIFLKVALPGSIPIVVAGLRLGVGRALTGTIVAELFGATAGLGYSVALQSQRLKTTQMMTSIVVVILLGVILTQLLSLIERRTESWRVQDRA